MIRFEKFEKADFDRLISWIDSELFMVQFSGPIFQYPLTHPQLDTYIDATSRLIYKVIDDANHVVIGHAELNNIDRKNQTARICRILVGEKENRGKGYGKQIIQKLMQIGFEELKLHRIDLGVFDFNESAIQCYLSCGFAKEGLLRESFKVGNQFLSVYNLAILDWEYNQLKNSRV